jgi:hypothetical protein
MTYIKVESCTYLELDVLCALRKAELISKNQFRSLRGMMNSSLENIRNFFKNHHLNATTYHPCSCGGLAFTMEGEFC